MQALALLLVFKFRIMIIRRELYPLRTLSRNRNGETRLDSTSLPSTITSAPYTMFYTTLLHHALHNTSHVSRVMAGS
jgi:hypothetical protein